ncbi:hypothetical protein COO60DRAFT_939133 [Scenedesmus sp. NREL 46B-D3]|nr:hypothetical protein COO60DRAFT_939133 [Scenedesmus sp. NREL 46B-D3]
MLRASCSASSSSRCRCCCSSSAGGDGWLLQQRAEVGRPQPSSLRFFSHHTAQTCTGGTIQPHAARLSRVHDKSSSSLGHCAGLNSVRPSAALGKSTNGETQDSSRQLDAALDAAAEEDIWTLQDCMQETGPDEVQQQPPQGYRTASPAGTKVGGNSSSGSRKSTPWAKQNDWEQQQVAKQQAKRRQAQQQAGGGNSSISKAAGMPYAYDMSRWQVRNKEWRQGPPANLDYLVVTPHNAAEKHARYMVRRLLGGSSGRMLLLFHSHKGATKALAILRAATHFLQRKHKCSLLCQVGFTVHDPLRMRLLVTLWPYAGVLHPTPLPAPEADSSSSSDCSGSDSSETEQQQAAADVGGCSAAARSAPGSACSSNSAASNRPIKQHRGWMARCLEGSVPEPQTLPRCCSHLPPLAVPDVVSHHVTLNASRHSEPPKLAQLICSALALKGRCRVCSAGGIAAFHALTAVALSELMLMRSSSSSSSKGGDVGQGLALHVRAAQRREALPAGSRAEFHVVRYFEFTLLLCKDVGNNGELIPAMCVFPVQRNSQQQRQQQQPPPGHLQGRRQQQQRQRLLQADDEDDEGEGYLW